MLFFMSVYFDVNYDNQEDPQQQQHQIAQKKVKFCGSKLIKVLFYYYYLKLKAWIFIQLLFTLKLIHDLSVKIFRQMLKLKNYWKQHIITLNSNWINVVSDDKHFVYIFFLWSHEIEPNICVPLKLQTKQHSSFSEYNIYTKLQKWYFYHVFINSLSCMSIRMEFCNRF